MVSGSPRMAAKPSRSPEERSRSTSRSVSNRRSGEPGGSLTDGAVDGFSNDVGVSIVPGGLLDHVHQDPSQGHVFRPGPGRADDILRGGTGHDVPASLA